MSGRFRGAGQPDAGFARWQRNKIFAPHNFFHLLQALPVMRQDSFAGDLILFQFTDDVAVIARSPAPLLGDSRGDHVHLFLQIDESGAGFGGQFRRGNIDAVGIEGDAIQLRRQAEIFARTRQDFLAHKIIVGGNLLFNRGHGHLVFVLIVLFKEFADAINISFAVGQVLFHVVLKWAKQVLIGQLFADSLFGLLGQWSVACLKTRIFFQAHVGGFAERRWDLIVKQAANAAEDHLGHPGVGQPQALNDVAGLDLIL